MNRQREHYNKLSLITHPQNLKVTIVKYDSRIEKYVPTKRVSVDKYELYDDRNVAVNEIVFDFDWKSYKANYQQAKKVVEVLKNRGVPHYICATGGKGIHIHTFFSKMEFKTKEGKEAFKEALAYDFSFKNIRLWFWNLILEEAGIEDKYRKKQLDPQVITFNYFQGGTHLIRAIGGRKFTKDSEGDWKQNYKTYIPADKFTSKKIIVTNFDEVTFPSDLKSFNINENELIDYLKQYVKTAEKANKQRLTNERIKGKYTEIDAVLKIREGLGEGQRSSGASVIAIAARIDNLTKTEAYEIASEYANNCSQSGSKFTPEEAKQWVDWIYNHEKPFWNCSLTEELGVHDRTTCEHCQMRNKESLELLTRTDLLKQVKEVLDEEIVGEDDTKMIVFLLALSKDFPSKTGKPGWNLINDPSSQNIIFSSDSASGKSWITKRVLDLLGDEEEDYFVISRMSKNVINYYTDLNMDGKIIFIEEMQGLDENTSQLRVWMSEGKLSFDTVEKAMNDEGQEVNVKVRKVTQGQPVFITNQAEGVVGDQLNNRSWVLGTDASKGQTSNILDYQDELHTGRVKINKVKKRLVKDALKQLKPYHFIIPFADSKAMGIPTKDVRARRDYTKFMTLIQCSAYLHQHQRTIHTDEDGNEFLICSLKDYDIAKQYSEGILGATFSGLVSGQIDLLNHLKKDSWDNTFTVSDIMRNLGKSQSHWYGVLQQLEDLGYIISEKSPGKTSVYELVKSKVVTIINLPSSEELFEKIAAKEHDKNSWTYKWIQGKKSEPNTRNDSKQKNRNFLGSVKSYENSVSAETQNNTSLENSSKHLVKSYDIIECENRSDLRLVNTMDSRNFLRGQDVLEFMRKQAGITVKHETIETEFKDYENLEETIQKLKTTGDIYETKPGSYVILE